MVGETGETGETGEATGPEGTVGWGELLAETVARLGASPHVELPIVEARWICQEASGFEGAEWVLGRDAPATVRGVARLDELVARRLEGEPIQYVLGSWAFRTLELLVDRRVLIPRPETEQVVEVALAELDRIVGARGDGHRPLVVDLGTGSGAIALSLVAERPGTQVWATDRSADALAVARANLAALGMAGGGVRLAEGDWFAALPEDLAGQVDLVVSNPPYVAADEALPPSVADWEPTGALVPGPSGLEAYDVLVAEAPRWLAPGGALVLEVGAGQAAAVGDRCRAAGLVDVRVVPDLGGLDRAVVGRRP
jgi:release factor glutamine methyltransferase